MSTLSPYLCDACIDFNEPIIKHVLSAHRLRRCEACKNHNDCSMTILKILKDGVPTPKPSPHASKEERPAPSMLDTLAAMRGDDPSKSRQRNIIKDMPTQKREKGQRYRKAIVDTSAPHWQS